MKNSIFTIMKKELTRFFTDKRMLITTIFLPGIMIYVIYTFMGDALMNNFQSDENYKPTVYAVNMPSTLNNFFESAEIKIDEADKASVTEIKSAIKNGDKDILMVFPPEFEKNVSTYTTSSGEKAPNIEIFYNSSDTDSDSAYSKITALLDGFESSITNKFDINNSKESYDLADEKDITGMLFSSMLPMLLMIFMFSGCMAVAPESIAGEKERGTIASLLITPAKRSNIALGKIFALSIISILSGVSSATGTILSLPKLMGGDENGVVANVYGVSDYAWLALIILSTVLLLVTSISIISAFAKTIKEAQSYVSPLMILVMLIGVSGMFGGGIKAFAPVYLIPLYNSVQCMVGIFSFEIVPTYLITTAISNIVYSAIGVLILTKMFNSEKVIFSK